MRASYAILHRGMLIAKSPLRDLCSALGPYCKKCICMEWSVISDPGGGEYMEYRRSGFNCKILILANCEFLAASHAITELRKYLIST